MPCRVGNGRFVRRNAWSWPGKLTPQVTGLGPGQLGQNPGPAAGARKSGRVPDRRRPRRTRPNRCPTDLPCGQNAPPSAADITALTEGYTEYQGADGPFRDPGARPDVSGFQASGGRRRSWTGEPVLAAGTRRIADRDPIGKNPGLMGRFRAEAGPADEGFRGPGSDRLPTGRDPGPAYRLGHPGRARLCSCETGLLRPRRGGGGPAEAQRRGAGQIPRPGASGGGLHPSPGNGLKGTRTGPCPGARFLPRAPISADPGAGPHVALGLA